LFAVRAGRPLEEENNTMATTKAKTKAATEAAAVVKSAPRTGEKHTAGARVSSIESGARAESGRWSPSISVSDLPLPEGYFPKVDLPAGYRPKGDEEYMSAQQLEYFRRKLLIWRHELIEESQQTIENLRDEVRDVGDEAERATRETENSLELRTRDRYRKLIGKIDKALKRVEDGRYGYCEETDEEIGLERLEARPIATMCLDAQERWEHRQRQMGD
jgi:DnaK suppressor protein